MRARAFREPHLRPPAPRAEELPELIARAQRDEAGAQEALVAFLRPMVGAAARRVARRSNTDAQDLEQEVWLGLLRQRWAPFARYDPALGSLERYARGVAQNLAWTAARARRMRVEAQPGVEEEVLTLDPVRQIEARELWSRFLGEVARALPPIGRSVVDLLADGEPAQHIAQRLGCRPQVVYNWTHKARRLAALLGGAPWRDE